MHLADATWTDAESVDGSLAVVPVGSTEQHGPHAPLGTDAMSAEAIAQEGADAYDDEVVVAPTIPVGISEEHRHFAGTLWVSDDTFRAYVRETISSLASHGWDRVVVVNGHGGNTAALREICGRLTRDGTAYAVPFTWFDAIDPSDLDADQDMGHAGSIETSFLRHVHPDLVREERFEAAREGAADRWGEWQSGTNLAYDTASFAENGVVGDPEASSEHLGERLLDMATDALVDLLEAVGDRDLSEQA